jgi:hypothetical protein
MKYLLSCSYFIFLSFTSWILAKSKLLPEIIITTSFHFISFFISFSASVERAQAGSTTIPSSFRYSSIVVHTLFSGQVITGSWYSFAILKVISHTFLTLAPSTKVSISSSGVFSHFSSESFIPAAHSGSTHMIFVFFPSSFVIDIIHATSHHHHIGQMIKSGSILSYISSHIVACQVIILLSSKGCTKVVFDFFSNFLLSLYASSKVSQ